MSELILARQRKPDGIPTITPESMKAKAREGLCNEGHLDLFLLWYQLGGIQTAPTPLELRDWPATMVKDWIYLLGRLGKLEEMHRVNAD